jgi:hypothetical protein
MKKNIANVCPAALSMTVLLALTPAACLSTSNPGSPDDEGAQVDVDPIFIPNGLGSNVLAEAPILNEVDLRRMLLSHPLKARYDIVGSGSFYTHVSGQVCRAKMGPAHFSHSLDVMREIVECALAPGLEVKFDCSHEGAGNGRWDDREDITLHGKLGLTPGWRTGSCGDDCKKWVSSCVIARRNYGQDKVELDLVSSKLAPRDASVNKAEGTYWGNIFLDDMNIRGCRIPAAADSPLLNRPCAPGGTGGVNCATHNEFDNVIRVNNTNTLPMCDTTCGRRERSGSKYYWAHCGGFDQTITVWQQ